MKKTTLTLTIAVLLAMSTTAQARDFTKKDFLHMGAKEITCTVDKIGAFNFFARCGDEEINFLTSKKTLYVPAGEKLRYGDVVNVVHYAPEDAGGSVFKKQAVTVEILKQADFTPLNSPQIGIVTTYKERGKKGIYFPKANKLIVMERVGSVGSDAVDLKPGAPYKFRFKRVPTKIGNGYAYTMTGVDYTEENRPAAEDTNF